MTMPFTTKPMQTRDNPSHRSQLATSGFTLVEVMIGALLTLTFLGVTTQAFVMSAVFRARGKELSEATRWIQGDLEQIKFQAANLNANSTSPRYPFNMIDHQNSCNAIDGTSGYGDWLRDELFGSDQTSLQTAQDLPLVSSTGNKPYVLRRVINLDHTNPHVAKIRHAVYDQNDAPADPTDTSHPASLATFYSEVMPNASFVCP